MNLPVTMLAPLNATFSSDAYRLCISAFGAPPINDEPETGNFFESGDNSETVDLVLARGGYGILPFYTIAEERIEKSARGLCGLFFQYKKERCPVKVIGAVRLRVRFVLMVRQDFPSDRMPEKIIGHPKSLGACQQFVKQYETEEIPAGNGAAAKLIATDPAYARCAVIGPACAAVYFGLKVIRKNCEDKKAVTTFFLIGPKDHQMPHRRSTGSKAYSATAFFRFYGNRSGQIHEATGLFAERDISLIDIHSAGEPGQNGYCFSITTKHTRHREALQEALDKLREMSKHYLGFGPYPVISA